MSKKLVLMVAAAIVLVFGILVWSAVKVNNSKPSQENLADNQPAASPTGDEPQPGVENSKDALPEEIQITEESDTRDWQTYRNEEYGFEMKYPKELGRVTLHTKNGFDLNKEKISGRQMMGEFSETADIKFGGITADYIDPRSVCNMDFSAYKIEDANYFFMSSSSLFFPISPKKIINERILFLDCTSFEQNCVVKAPSVAFYTDQIGGLLNLNNEEFRGLIFLANKNKINESLFIKMLCTVKVL